jgi:hypothetical protein
MMTPGTQAAGAPQLGSTNLGLPVTQWGASIAILKNILGGQTVVTFRSGFTIPSAAVIYELTPCTNDQVGQLNVTPSNSETGPSITEPTNAAYFQVIEQDTSILGSYNSVSSPWVFDYTLSPLPQTGSSMGAVAYILNTTGAQAPTWNVTNGSTHCGAIGIGLLDNAPTVSGIIAETQIDAYPAGGQANSFVRFRLRNYAGTVPAATSSTLAAITATLDTGTISQNLVPNSSISPAGTFYTIEIWSNGRITTSGNVTITASGDLSTLL